MLASLRYTLEFVLSSLPPRSTRVLEIGCGNGALARALVDRSLQVVAIDSDPDAVAQARKAGVDARLATWPAAIDAPFDAILFTRSLHHIAPLEEAVAAATRLLTPHGRIIVEDFRAEGGSQRSARWFEEQLADLAAQGAFRPGAEPEAIVERSMPDAHEHELHSSERIADALANHGQVERNGAAYYFRYAEPELASPEIARTMLRSELVAIANGRIDALGQRFLVIPAARA